MARIRNLAIFFLLTIALKMMAGEPINARISQVHVRLPELTVYLELPDVNGLPSHGIQASQLTATVGSNWAAINGIKPFEQSGEGVAYVLLTDISRSLKPQQFTQMKQALFGWIDGLQSNDRAAVMSFGEEVKVVQDFSADKDRLKTAVNSLTLTDTQTQLYAGLIQAMEIGRRADST